MWTRRLGGVPWLVAASLALSPIPARADCPVDPGIGTGPAATPVDARLRFIRSHMDVGARRARIWSATWGAAYGVAAVTQLSVTPLVSKETRVDLYVGASSAVIGTLVRSFAVPRVVRERRRLARKMDAGGDSCEVLQEAERGLARSAKSEAFGQSLLLRLGAIVYNVGIGVMLGVGLKRPVSGIRQATIGATVGQIMIVTQPTTMIETLARYRGGRLSPQPPRYVQPLVLRGGGGFSLGGRF